MSIFEPSLDALLLKFPQIRKYLKHDCLGLLEVVDSFSKVVWEVSWASTLKYLVAANDYGEF